MRTKEANENIIIGLCATYGTLNSDKGYSLSTWNGYTFNVSDNGITIKDNITKEVRHFEDLSAQEVDRETEVLIQTSNRFLFDMDMLDLQRRETKKFSYLLSLVDKGKAYIKCRIGLENNITINICVNEGKTYYARFDYGWKEFNERFGSLLNNWNLYL